MPVLRLKRLSAPLVGALMILSAPASGQQCNFIAPPDWSSATSIRWFGPCERGVASGSGVLRTYLNGKPGPAFYGRMANGTPRFGVIETEEGFAAGNIVEGEAKAKDRQVIIDAFRVAAQAARAASARFKTENNAGSARFYAEKANQLDRQMD